MQRYSTNFRQIYRIKQRDQVRPKAFSIYNFTEQGAKPLPATRFYKAKTLEESKWMLKFYFLRSPKWSWLLHHRYERLTTHLKGVGVFQMYKDFVIRSRVNAAAQQHGLSGAQLHMNLIHLLKRKNNF